MTIDVTSRVIRGVALVITNPGGEVMTIRENETKPYLGKYAGMHSIPMETKRASEPDSQALARLVTEELPGFSDRIQIIEKRRGVYRIVSGVLVSLYEARMLDSSLPLVINGIAEVDQHAWKPVAEATCLWLRRGAFEMLDDFRAGRTRVFCRECRDVQTQPPGVFPLHERTG
jgi:hypothetical protein